ncbi:MAG: formylglycine-generating enzyme family protein [Bacteroidia bacterium]
MNKLLIITLFNISIYNASFSQLKEIDSFVYMPLGKTFFNEKSFNVEPFYIYKTEIPNSEYLKFVNSLPKEQRISYLPNDKIWANDSLYIFINNSTYGDRVIDNYSSQLNDYPVVNISYESALKYCEWKTNEINQKRKLNFRIEVTLPNEEQWMRAVRDATTSGYIYGTKEGKLVGKSNQFLCNFSPILQEMFDYNLKEKSLKSFEFNRRLDGYPFTAPVTSFEPNQFGLYNLSGNVAEMLIEKGKIKGGSWISTGKQLWIDNFDFFVGESPFVGFRPIIIVKQ